MSRKFGSITKEAVRNILYAGTSSTTLGSGGGVWRAKNPDRSPAWSGTAFPNDRLEFEIISCY